MPCYMVCILVWCSLPFYFVQQYSISLCDLSLVFYQTEVILGHMVSECNTWDWFHLKARLFNQSIWGKINPFFLVWWPDKVRLKRNRVWWIANCLPDWLGMGNRDKTFMNFNRFLSLNHGSCHIQTRNLDLAFEHNIISIHNKPAKHMGIMDSGTEIMWYGFLPGTTRQWSIAQ